MPASQMTETIYVIQETPQCPPTTLGPPTGSTGQARTINNACLIPPPTTQQENDNLPEKLRLHHEGNMAALDSTPINLSTIGNPPGQGNAPTEVNPQMVAPANAQDSAIGPSVSLSGADQQVPRVTAADVAARLQNSSTRPMAAATIQAQQPTADDPRRLCRQEQLNANIAVNVLPIGYLDPSRWRPPYAWDPTQANAIPAFLTHPRLANGPTLPQVAMDPPMDPEVFPMASATPLQQPGRSVNSNVRDMVDQIHKTRHFGTGSDDDMPYTTYGPTPPTESRHYRQDWLPTQQHDQIVRSYITPQQFTTCSRRR